MEDEIHFREPVKKYYRTNVNDPVIRECYEAFKKKLGLPTWCPLSDRQREYFDDLILNGKAGEECAEKTDK